MKLIAATLALALLLGGCATTGPTQDQRQEWRDNLTKAEMAATLAEVGYDGMCASSIAPKFCRDPRANAIYASTKDLLSSAFQSAEDALAAETFDETTIRKLFKDAIDALSKLEKVISDVRSNRAPQ